jgi:hypothetical protein
LREAPGPDELGAIAAASGAVGKEAPKRSLRKQLLGLRAEIVAMLGELGGR